MTYAEDARNIVAEEMTAIGSPPKDWGYDTDNLLDLYTLLALSLGESVTAEALHDAWVLWQRRTQPDNRWLVPFHTLPAKMQQLDDPYCEAIRRAARRLPRYMP